MPQVTSTRSSNSGVFRVKQLSNFLPYTVQLRAARTQWGSSKMQCFCHNTSTHHTGYYSPVDWDPFEGIITFQRQISSNFTLFDVKVDEILRCKIQGKLACIMCASKMTCNCKWLHQMLPTLTTILSFRCDSVTSEITDFTRASRAFALWILQIWTTQHQ